MAENEKLTISVAEAAELLGVSVKTAYDLTHQEGFPAIQIKRRIRVSYSGLKEWIRRQSGELEESTAHGSH